MLCSVELHIWPCMVLRRMRVPRRRLHGQKYHFARCKPLQSRQHRICGALCYRSWQPHTHVFLLKTSSCACFPINLPCRRAGKLRGRAGNILHCRHRMLFMPLCEVRGKDVLLGWLRLSATAYKRSWGTSKLHYRFVAISWSLAPSTSFLQEDCCRHTWRVQHYG